MFHQGTKKYRAKYQQRNSKNNSRMASSANIEHTHISDSTLLAKSGNIIATSPAETGQSMSKR